MMDIELTPVDDPAWGLLKVVTVGNISWQMLSVLFSISSFRMFGQLLFFFTPRAVTCLAMMDDLT